MKGVLGQWVYRTHSCHYVGYLCMLNPVRPGIGSRGQLVTSALLCLGGETTDSLLPPKASWVPGAAFLHGLKPPPVSAESNVGHWLPFHWDLLVWLRIT
jgi:hypothetical protein